MTMIIILMMMVVMLIFCDFFCEDSCDDDDNDDGDVVAVVNVDDDYSCLSALASCYVLQDEYPHLFNMTASINSRSRMMSLGKFLTAHHNLHHRTVTSCSCCMSQAEQTSSLDDDHGC